MKKMMVLCVSLLIGTVVFAQSNMPITGLTLNMLVQLCNSGGNIGEVQFYLSDSLRMVQDSKTQFPDITINKNDEGKIISFPAAGVDTIEVIFQANNYLIPLKFRWDAQKNKYIPYSVTINTKSYNLNPHTELPHLLIRSDIDSHTKNVYAVISPAGKTQAHTARPIPVAHTAPLVWYFPPAPYSAPAPVRHTQQYAGFSRNICGTGSLTKACIIEYIRCQNPAAIRIIGPLVDIYFEEARAEGINHDIAIAQMLHATNFLGNERMVTHNYAGLLNTREWDGRFPYRMYGDGMREGVRAHIQHLKAYTSYELNRPLVDPRYEILKQLNYIGRVRTFDELYNVWSADSVGYRNSIERILQGLYFNSR
jgi:hypothetical protein